MPYTEAQKDATYKWRHTHQEQYRLQQQKDDRNYYTRHKDEISKRRSERRKLLKELS